jgi:VWFA-related protein
MTSGAVLDHPKCDQEPKVEFHSETVLVQVPVVVIDKQGNHVPGLTRQDFEVLENGKAQKIATFEEFTTAKQALAPESGSSNTFSNSLGITGKPHNVMAVVLDTVTRRS